MANLSDLNQQFIIEVESPESISACTDVYTTHILSCSGDSSIILSGSSLYLNGTVYSTSLFSDVIYSGSTNLLDLFITKDTFVTGGTYNPTIGLVELTNNSGGTFSFSGFFTGVTHDQTLTGDGTIDNPLKAIGSGDINDVVVTVRVATTANLAGAPVYNNGISGSGATLTRGTNGVLPNIDGKALIVGDRILVKNQTTKLQNGVYEVTSLGSTVSKWVLTRTTDADETTELDDMTVTPSEGTNNKGLLFAQQTNNPIVGVNDLVFTQISGIFLRQLGSGTQVASQIPIYTSSARQVTKGFSGFTYSATTNKTDKFTINSVPYFFPSGNTVGYLTNNGSGLLSWSTTNDIYITGLTFNPSNYNLVANRNDNVSLSTNLSILASDVTITGGTYDSNTGVATFTNNTGGTFNISGFLTGFTDIFITGGTYNNVSDNYYALTLNRNDNTPILITGFTDTHVVAGEYDSNGNQIILTFNNGDGIGISDIEGSVRHWRPTNKTIVHSETVVISGDYVLNNMILEIQDIEESISVGDLTFNKCGQLFIGGNLLIYNSQVINNGIINVAGGIIFNGNSDMTGTGVLI